MLALKVGTKREPSASASAKATEAAMSLEHSREEPSGVGGAGCCDSRRWNRGGLLWSVAHIHRDRWYKPGEVKSKGMPEEKSEEAILLMISKTTQLAEREGPLLQPS